MLNSRPQGKPKAGSLTASLSVTGCASPRVQALEDTPQMLSIFQTRYSHPPAVQVLDCWEALFRPSYQEVPIRASKFDTDVSEIFCT